MSPWSTRHYASIKESILLDIENLSKRLEVAKQELAEADSVEESCEIRERIKKLEGYLKTSETSLKRFEFRHTHDGRDPEEFYERKIEEKKIEEEVKPKRKPRQTGKEKVDYSLKSHFTLPREYNEKVLKCISYAGDNYTNLVNIQVVFMPEKTTSEFI